MATTKITGTGIGLPTADGVALGGASNEFSDLYLADGGVVYFGNDQEIKITHVADTGLTLKHTATADDKPITLTLQTGETDMAADDVIGKISFQAPDEGEGTDAILVSAAIQAVAEGNHSASSNATKLSFMTGASEAATEKMALSSAGNLTVTNSAADANAGPVLNLYRNSASPADDDLLGEIQFKGENSADQIVEYASIVGTPYDVTDGEEDGGINVDVMVAGTKTDALRIGPVAGTASIVQTLHSASSTAAVPNITFIGDNNTGMYRVGADAVGITTNGTKRMEINNTDVEISTGNIVFETADKGIYLGVTSATAANLLDDYEEGTWTPLMKGGTTDMTTGGYGRYQKLGRVVWVYFNISVTNQQSASGNLYIYTLPFTTGSDGFSGQCRLGGGDRVDAITLAAVAGGSQTYLNVNNVSAAPDANAAAATVANTLGSISPYNNTGISGIVCYEV